MSSLAQQLVVGEIRTKPGMKSFWGKYESWYYTTTQQQVTKNAILLGERKPYISDTAQHIGLTPRDLKS